MRLALLLFATCCAEAAAQEFVWEGEVDEVAVLQLRGKKLEVTSSVGAPVQHQKYQFHSALAESRQTVRLTRREGRGSVRIIEQPRLDNRYTLIVQIEDRQPGAAFYSVALHWEPDLAESPKGWLDKDGGVSQLTWGGRVDGDVIIACRMKSCESQVRSGAPVMGPRFRFTHPLPAQRVRVTLDSTDGRGDIRILEQPGDSNGYTAKISIRDPQEGSSQYSFTLSWPLARRR